MKNANRPQPGNEPQEIAHRKTPVSYKAKHQKTPLQSKSRFQLAPRNQDMPRTAEDGGAFIAELHLTVVVAMVFIVVSVTGISQKLESLMDGSQSLAQTISSPDSQSRLQGQI